MADGRAGADGHQELQLRIARHTERLREVVGFYRDGVGLTEIGGFHDHEGDDGVFLVVPGTAAHLEFTAGVGMVLRCRIPNPCWCSTSATTRRSR